MGFSLSRFHSVPVGELPPPAPRDCFGREELIEKVVGFAEKLEPVALIGSGGVGKTSIALTVLHHRRIEERFGENRRFIRCDQFPASGPHFLARLSKAIGAGVKNPEDMTPLRPLLSSKEMLIILDNAESILDPKGTNAEEIYSVVDELCQFKKVCLCITSRITTVPPRCKRPEIPTLSMEAASDIFYTIYGGDEGRSHIVSGLLGRLDFHALSITLLATTASQNAWDHDRLVKEWNTQRARVLQTLHNKSLAATIELSLSSPTFQSLGSDARDLLGVIAFFPQGIDEKNLDWLFPTIPNTTNIFDGFCVLSLTYRSNGFITMLAPIRDYLGPKDPQSSSLLCATRDRYFNRLSVNVGPTLPGFEEARWIALEDLNAEHLLDVFASINQNTGVWEACFHFIGHLVWHKPRQTVLRPRVEGLPDNHPFKSKCLFELSLLFQQIGNHGERKKLISHALELERQRGDDVRIARTLSLLADVNRILHLQEEGIRQAREALEIYERTGNTIGEAECLNKLSWLLFDDKQLDPAENAASRAIDLVEGGGREFLVTQLHRILGKIHYSKGSKEKAIHHFNTALGIASPRDWNDQLFWVRFDMAILFRDECQYEGAYAEIERAKSHAIGDVYRLGRAMKLQAEVLYLQGRLQEAKSGALHALENYEKAGAARNAELCMELLETIEKGMKETAY